MKLPYFSARFVRRLKELAGANVAKYGTGAGWVESFASGQVFMHESKQVVEPPPTLAFGSENNSKHDAENSRRIYGWLEQVSPALAMEERLWACLSHMMFPEYMAARWPVADIGAVQRRYLFEGSSFAALTRNGIGRLWWAGYLTKDSERANPFELTETLFMRQDIEVSLLERSLGKCRGVRFAVLDFLKANNTWIAQEAFGKRIQILLRELNLLGGVAILDALPPSAIHRHLEKVGRRLIQGELN